MPKLNVKQYMITGELICQLFQACNTRKCLIQLHSIVIKTGLSQENHFSAKLIALYSKFDHVSTTRKLFDETPHRTVHIWNFILKSYCKEKRYRETLSLFSQLFSSGEADVCAVSIVLKACAGLKALEFGRMVQGFVKKSDGIRTDLFVGSGLIEMYSKCGEMGCALCVLEEFSEPDAVLWTTLVTGYEQNGDPKQAMKLFTRMVNVERIVIDCIALVSVLSACTQVIYLQGGRSVHGYMLRAGFESVLSLSNALLSFYGKTGLVDAAAKLFERMETKDVISWGSIISCYAHNERTGEALNLFEEMMARGIEPNAVVMISALQACEAAGNLEMGRRINELAGRKGLDIDIMIATALIEMYMNCCSPDEANVVFEKMLVKDATCYSALLRGCVQNGMLYESMGVFCDMLAGDFRPTCVDMVKVLTVCSELSIYRQTSSIHGFIVKFGMDNEFYIVASLIESYAKCGSLDCAIKVFKGIKDRDVAIWNSMFAGYGFHGKGREALELFDQMIKYSQVRPNHVTFISLLSACSHAGLVREGIDIFNTMVNDYQLVPNSKHYGIVVDLLGRIGKLNMAMEFISQMTEPVTADAWGALLGASQIHHNMEVGEISAKEVLKLDPSQTGHYVTLSNLYAVDEKWDNVGEVRRLVQEKKLKKVSGQSLVDLYNEICVFTANDRSHKDYEQIYELLARLGERMKEESSVCNDILLMY